MKRTIIALAALTLAFAFTGCANNSTPSADSAAETEIAASEENTTAAEGTQAAAAFDETALSDLTMKLLNEYVQIEYIGGLGLNADTNEMYQPEGCEATYPPVTDPNYQSLDDLKNLVAATLKNKGFRDTIEDITVTVDKTADGYRLSSYKVN